MNAISQNSGHADLKRWWCFIKATVMNRAWLHWWAGQRPADEPLVSYNEFYWHGWPGVIHGANRQTTVRSNIGPRQEPKRGFRWPRRERLSAALQIVLGSLARSKSCRTRSHNSGFRLQFGLCDALMVKLLLYTFLFSFDISIYIFGQQRGDTRKRPEFFTPACSRHQLVGFWWSLSHSVCSNLCFSLHPKSSVQAVCAVDGSRISWLF